MEEKPSYYSILPADVRYDKELKANEKLLYSEITSLCNKTGICYASNKYFANLYDVDIATISRWINHLIDLNYLSVDYEKDNKRLLTIKSIPIDEKINRVLTKKSNIIINNNNKYNKEEIIKEENVFDYYQSNIGILSPKQYEKLNNYLDKYSKEDIIKAIDISVDNNAKSFNYFNSVLVNGIYTNKKEKDIPKWMDTINESEEMSEEELNELEKEFEIFN